MTKVEIIDLCDSKTARIMNLCNNLNSVKYVSKRKTKIIQGHIDDKKLLNKTITSLDKRLLSREKRIKALYARIYGLKGHIKTISNRGNWARIKLSQFKTNQRFFLKDFKKYGVDESLKKTVNNLIQYEKAKESNKNMLLELVLLQAAYQIEFFVKKDIDTFYGGKLPKYEIVLGTLRQRGYVLQCPGPAYYMTEPGRLYMLELLKTINKYTPRVFTKPIQV